jgi:hypothetical protein
MTKEEMLSAEILLRRAEIDHRAKTGYGNNTVRCIANSLTHGSLESAQAEWRTDGDKLHLYPELKKVVIQVLGCRLHFKQNCDSFICKEKIK